MTYLPRVSGRLPWGRGSQHLFLPDLGPTMWGSHKTLLDATPGSPAASRRRLLFIAVPPEHGRTHTRSARGCAVITRGPRRLGLQAGAPVRAAPAQGGRGCPLGAEVRLTELEAAFLQPVLVPGNRPGSGQT